MRKEIYENVQIFAKFYKNGVLKNMVKFTGKQLCPRLFFDKVTGVFSCEFCQIFKNAFSQNTSGRLLLNGFVGKPVYHIASGELRPEVIKNFLAIHNRK